MTRARLAMAATLALAACAAPKPPPGEAQVVVIQVPAPAQTPAGKLPLNAAAPGAVLHDSVAAKAEAGRYVAWAGSKPANIQTLAALNRLVTAAVLDMQRSQVNGRYGAKQVQAARAATDALRSFLQNKED